MHSVAPHPRPVIARSEATKQSSARWIATPDYVGLAMTKCMWSLFALIAFFITAARSNACTIFVLTDANETLFCNNEDWEDKPTCLWFVPERSGSWFAPKRYGCAYVGFGSNWGQGGMNTEGLAYDWLAGFQAEWRRAPEMKSVNGNPAERMLEQCATVEEAIAFFRKHWEPSFSYAKILIADRTGASVIIGAAGGRLDIQHSTASRGCGFGERALATGLGQDSAPTLVNAAGLLLAARQPGQYATRYSNVFDLKSGAIFVSTDQTHFARFDLVAELARGRHSYDLHRLAKPLEFHSNSHEREGARAHTLATPAPVFSNPQPS